MSTVIYGSPEIDIQPAQSTSADIIKYGNPEITDNYNYITQGVDDNVLNKITHGIRKFLSIDEHPNDFPKLLAVEQYGSASDENVQKIYQQMGLSPNYTDEVVNKFFNTVTLGIVPQEKLPEPVTTTGKVALALANSVSSLAGFVVADALTFGTLGEVSKLFTSTDKFANLVSKLTVLRKFSSSIASLRPKASLISAVLGSGLRLGLDTALVNIVNANERTNNIYQAIKDVEPEVLQNALFGAGLPFLSVVKSPLNRILFAIGLGNTASYVVTGKTDIHGIVDGIVSADPQELTNSLFNTLLDAYFGYTAHVNEFRNDKNIEDMHQYAQDIENHSKAQKETAIDETIEAIKPKEKEQEETIKNMFGGVPISEWKKPIENLIKNHTLPLDEKDISKLTFAIVDPFHAQYVVKSDIAKDVFKRLNDVVLRAEESLRPIHQELSDITESLDGVIKNADDKTIEAVKKAIVEGDKKQKDPVEILRQYKDIDFDKAKRMVELHQQFYKTVLKEYAKHVEKTLEEMRQAGVDEKKIEFMRQAFYPNIGELKYYMPRMRKPGNVVINVYKDSKLVYSKPVSDLFAYLTGSRSIIAKLYEKELKQKYGNDIEIQVKQTTKPDVSKMDVFSVMDTFRDVIDSHVDEKTQQKIISELIDTLKAQGFISKSIHRSKTLIEGYEEDPFKVLPSFAASFMSFLRKQQIKLSLMDIANSIPSNTPTLRKAFENIKDELLRNKDATDKIVNTVRGLLYLKYIGFSIRNGFVNVTFQPAMTGMHLAVEFGRGSAVDYVKAEAELVKAIKDIITNNISEKEQRVLNKLDEWGITSAQRTIYTMGKTLLNSGYLWNKLLDISGWIMSKTEIVNRKSAALAFIRAHINDEGMTINRLANLTKEFVYLTNGKYGDTNLPIMFQGKGELKRWARIGQTFQTYNHQMLLSMLKLWQEKHRAPILMGLGLMMLLGGMQVMPLYETIKSLYMHLTGRDLEVDLANKLNHNTLSQILSDGLVGTALGVDVSSSSAITLPTDELRFMGDSLSDKVMNVVFGVGYQSVKDMFKSVGYMEKGDWYKALYYGIPARFMAYPIKALQEYKVGITTNGDLLLIDPTTNKPLQLTEKEAVLQALGFTPERIANYRNLVYTFKTIDNYYTRKKHKLYTRYRVAIANGNFKKAREIAKEMFELNRRIFQLNRSGYFISPANIDRIDTVEHNMRMLNFLKTNFGG